MSSATIDRPLTVGAALLLPQVRTLDVGQDLDGVQVWFDRSYYFGCVKLGMIDPAEHPWHPGQRWDFYEDLGHSAADFIANCNQLADLGILWDGDPIPGTETMWDAILDAGHRIHVKTDRPFGTHPIASEVGTRMWLRRHNRHYHSITFSADKTTGPRVDIMLEDKVENYDALDAAGQNPYLINRLWNAPYDDGRRRVTNYDQFLARVLQLGSLPATDEVSRG